jgi:hypothetical protein
VPKADGSKSGEKFILKKMLQLDGQTEFKFKKNIEKK